LPAGRTGRCAQAPAAAAVRRLAKAARNARRRHGQQGHHYRAARHQGLIPMKRGVFTALLIGSAAGGAARLLAAETPNEISVMARKFDFTPDTIKVKVGQPVTLVLTSFDRIHGFKMPE